MRASVRAAFYGYTAPFEGVVPWLYADVIGLITTGVGNLVDPIEAALRLPFRRQDGSLATSAEIAAEWQRVKNDPKAAQLGHRYAQRITSLRLTPEAIGDLVLGKLDAHDRELARRFAAWESWPADAQLATHSMAWACGPGFRFPRLEAALRALRFDEAANEAHINTTGNPGVVPRNAAQRTLYRNAHEVRVRQLDPEALYWPRELRDEVAPMSWEIVHPRPYLGRPGEEPPPDGEPGDA